MRENLESGAEMPDEPLGAGMGLRLELFVEDMDASIKFYIRVVGLDLIRNEPGYYAALRNGGVVLGLGPVSRLAAEGGYFSREIANHRRGLGVESCSR